MDEMNLDAVVDLGRNNVYLSLVRSLHHYLIEIRAMDVDLFERLYDAEQELLAKRREIQARLWSGVA